MAASLNEFSAQRATGRWDGARGGY